MNVARATASLALVAVLACQGGPDAPVADVAGPVPLPPASAYEWRLPKGFPKPFVPDDNPMSEEKVELGRALFYDRRLSFAQRTSCATCHQQRAAFADARGVSRGEDTRPHPRSAPSLANVGYHARLQWASPELRTLETQARGPLLGEGAPIVEMGLTSPDRVATALERLRRDARYPAWFARAFPGVVEFTLVEVSKALAAFQRTLISGDAPFDRYARGERDAMPIEAIRGRFLFLDHEKGVVCHHCHDGPFLTNEGRWEGKPFDEIVFTNVGLYNVGGSGDYPSGLQGLFETTRNRDDRGKFRTPTLRNVAVTAPYMHDGSVATLQEVIDIYAEGGRNVVTGPLQGDGRLNPVKDRGLGPMRLTEVERAEMRAFLEALTDQTFLQDPRFGNPFPSESDFGE